ncbi:TonB-dependent receptor [Marinimicrobium sp. C6131]|uniref:TonB-dependent receptor n=1 Tax=Marinimicrobium sp. C6131 TaxID=3022676 RepID=UPI00223E6902|nr:TonB-dependent receptor [Marinimicrobium sp. C6131]UZJ43603.1 TonB-dependent receptor [Marinimicrobium sp. C6131]
MPTVFNKKLLSLVVCSAAVATTQPAVAQGDEALLEEIVVRGMRSSIETSQDIKRNADTFKDVITASDIGALPDRSVTEALQRVPGVTIERFASSDDPKHYADEGTGVLVRGLDRVRSEINGRDAFSANPWGGLSYEDFPAELLGSVEVVKNQTADLISGGIAGTVNLITRKPFDSEGRLVSLNAKGHYGDYREEVTPSFSALFSDNWETSAGRFGFLIAGSQSEYQTRGDGVGLGNYHSRGVLDTFSYDEWGTATPGVIEGQYSNPCIPGASDWRACDALGFEDTVQYDAEDAAAFVPPYEGEALEGQPDGVTWYAPANYHISTAENDRERTGFTTSLQWANTDETIVATLEHINSKASLEWRERVIASGDRGFLPYVPNTIQWFDERDEGRPLTVNNQTDYDGDGFLTSGVGRANHPEMPLQFRSRYNYNENTVEDTSLNVQLNPSDRMTLSLDYQRVESTQVVHNYNLTSRINGNQTFEHAPFFMDLRGDTPTFEYLNSNTSNPPEVDGPVDGTYTNPILRLSNGMQQEVDASAESDSFQVDFQYDFDGAFTSIQAGAYYSEKDLAIADTEYEGWQALGTPWSAEGSYNASPQVAPELFERVSFADQYDGKVVQGPNNSFLFPRMDLSENYIQTLRDGCGSWSALGNAMDGSGECALPYEDLDDRLYSHFAPRHISSTNEERSEFYVRGNFEFDDWAVPLTGNVGLRYVNYQLASTGNVTLPPTARRGTSEDESLYQVMRDDYPEIFALASGDSMLSTVQGTDYDTVLPSLNLSFGLTEDVVLRFGASKGLYYPTLTDARNSMVVSLDYTEVLQDPSEGKDEETNPVVDLTDIEISANARNPYLEPEESINLDLSAEWYFAPVGSLTVGLFHKDLDNIIRNRQFDTEVEHAGYTYPVSADGPANTGSGTIRGVEFSYSQFYDMLPGAWSGLGMQLNFTYIDQDGLEDPNSNPSEGIRYSGDGTPITDNRNSFRRFTGLPLVGYSDQNANIVGMYEYEDIRFRLAYTWRSEYLLTMRESEEFVPTYAKAQGMMDASLYYDISDIWSVGLEASNLLDEETKTQYQLNQAGDRTDALSFTTDRRYALSVRAVF